MTEKCRAESCKLPLFQGERIVQMATGKYFDGYITPTFSGIVAEWHEECFQEFTLRPQLVPYVCQTCHKPVKHGDKVIYICIGNKAGPDHIEPEDHGYEMYLVTHVACPNPPFLD